ncbi:MFS transporter [Nocardiopsis mangrovi]|uniref:MFS transporter n=1 Tax=Nocardiopsis mangrovi TaxID=1179818 RepID=A0ABV9E5F2_9ACTN
MAETARGHQETPTGHPRRWRILAAVCAALLVIVLDNTVVNLALPSIAAAFGASTAQQQAVVDAYVVVFAGLLIAAGAAADRYGRRRAMVAGLVVLGMASAAAAAAGSVWWLVAMRAAMGVGAALVMPATLAVIVQVFPAHERPRAFAAWAAVAAVAMATGPVLGGLLVAVWSWAGVFLINVPVAAAAVAAILRLVPESRDPARSPVEPAGALLATVGMAALVTAVIAVGGHGSAAPVVLGCAAVAVVALTAFVRGQSRSAAPLVDFSLYRDRGFAGGSAAAALLTLGTGSALFVIGQYLQLVLGHTPLEAGVAVVPLAAGTVLGSAAGGRAPERIGARAAIVLGLAATSAGFVLLAAPGPDGPYAVVAAGLLLAGAGTGFAGPATTSTVLGAVPPDRAGMGSALNDTHQQLGIALGVAALGGLLSAAYRAGLPASAPAEVQASPAGALAHAAGGPGRAELAEAARIAFTGAQSLTMLAAAGCAAAGAITALLVLPPRTADTPGTAPPTG